MSGQMMIFVCLLALNTLVALIYLAWSILKKNNKGYIFRTAVMLLCPVVGICFFLLSYLWYRLFFAVSVDLEDVIFSKERVKAVTHAEEEQERNMVPLEEAIVVTDEEDLRTLMMNVVRGDIQKYLSSIALALNSEDTETAHYAATVLQDAFNDFRMNVQRQMLLVEGAEDAYVYMDQLIDYMNRLLEQKVFTEMEQKNYVAMLDEICELYYEGRPGKMLSSQFEAVSMRLLEVRDFENCEKWCDRAEYHHPNTLSTYTCRLKLYFARRQKRQFFEMIEELKASDVVIDSETLEMIRVFR